jgi:hypothetical protein
MAAPPATARAEIPDFRRLPSERLARAVNGNVRRALAAPSASTSPSAPAARSRASLRDPRVLVELWWVLERRDLR